MVKNNQAIATEDTGLVNSVGAPVMRAAYALRSKPSWINLSEVEGTGNASVDVTAVGHKGRNGRSDIITVRVGELDQNVNLSQQGSNIWDVSTSSLAFIKDGETKEFIGTTNLASITYSVDSDASDWLTLSKVVVNDVEYGSGAAIDSDPGATDIYAFKLDVTADANDTVEARTGHITVNGIKYTITQAAGDATLEVSPTSLEFAAEGETKQIVITTNTDWVIE
ncbi:MAG: BACON domain-containing protein [Clostridia bacterium]|nr:BACON domain-containing protein [Clostridia bacterium]